MMAADRFGRIDVWVNDAGVYAMGTFEEVPEEVHERVIEVNYFGTGRTAFTEARGEVVIVLHEGTANEEKHVLPYELFTPKQTVTVAEVEVK